MTIDPSQIDLVWSSEGDILLENGTILDTKNEMGLTLFQAVRDRIINPQGSFREFPSVGVNLGAVLGKPIMETNLRDLENIIAAALNKDNFLGLGEFNVKAVVVSKNIAGLIIDIRSRKLNKQMKLLFNYDARENRVSLRRI